MSSVFCFTAVYVVNKEISVVRYVYQAEKDWWNVSERHENGIVETQN